MRRDVVTVKEQRGVPLGAYLSSGSWVNRPTRTTLLKFVILVSPGFGFREA
jgi:hypothetical protein